MTSIDILSAGFGPDESGSFWMHWESIDGEDTALRLSEDENRKGRWCVHVLQCNAEGKPDVIQLKTIASDVQLRRLVKAIVPMRSVYKV